MSSTPFMLRVISASVCAANKSGAIIREILKTGELGIVNKVRQESVKMSSLSLYIYIFSILPHLPRESMIHRLKLTEELRGASQPLSRVASLGSL